MLRDRKNVMKALLLLGILIIASLFAKADDRFDWELAVKSELNKRCSTLINWLRIEKDDARRQALANDLYSAIFLSWCYEERGLFQKSGKKNKSPHSWISSRIFDASALDPSGKGNPFGISNWEKYTKKYPNTAYLFKSENDYLKDAKKFELFFYGKEK